METPRPRKALARLGGMSASGQALSGPPASLSMGGEQAWGPGSEMIVTVHSGCLLHRGDTWFQVTSFKSVKVMIVT